MTVTLRWWLHWPSHKEATTCRAHQHGHLVWMMADGLVGLRLLLVGPGKSPCMRKHLYMALQDAVQSKLIDAFVFSGARLLLPCSSAQVVMSVMWVMSIMFPSDTVNLEQRWIISPSHCIRCHGIRRNMCPLGVWLSRASCWWACHPTRIVLVRLKAGKASPIQRCPHLQSFRFCPPVECQSALSFKETSGWDHQKLPFERTPAPEKYSAHLRLRRVRFGK